MKFDKIYNALLEDAEFNDDYGYTRNMIPSLFEAIKNDERIRRIIIQLVNTFYDGFREEAQKVYDIIITPSDTKSKLEELKNYKREVLNKHNISTEFGISGIESDGREDRLLGLFRTIFLYKNKLDELPDDLPPSREEPKEFDSKTTPDGMEVKSFSSGDNFGKVIDTLKAFQEMKKSEERKKNPPKLPPEGADGRGTAANRYYDAKWGYGPMGMPYYGD